MTIDNETTRITKTRADKDAAESAFRKGEGNVRALTLALTDAERRAETDPEAARLAERLRAELAESESRLDGLRGEWSDAGTRLASEIRELYQRNHRDLTAELNDSFPVLLAPVRLETKFFRNGDETELRVRIFPDAAAITAHRRELTAAEVATGQAFWREWAMAQAETDEAARAAAEEGAAKTLVSGREERAAWIANQTRPRNWPEPDDTTAPPAPEALDFSELDPLPEGVAAPPRAPLLPDRFVVMTLNSGEITHEIPAAPIADDLALGPDPQALSGFIERSAQNGKITTDPALTWLFDYEAAVTTGLAVTIPITAEEAETGFDRVIALGLRHSTSAADSAELLESLIVDQIHSEGFDLLRQGAPTNNTEEAPSDFTSDSDVAVAAFLDRMRAAPPAEETDAKDKTDVQRLAEALGINTAMVSLAPSAPNMDVAEALAMNRALWPATLGGFFIDFLSPTVDVGLRRRIEDFFLTYVAGRGLLPAIRVGRQPYGVLVTSALPKWSLDETAIGQKVSDFPAELKPVMDRLDTEFRTLEADVAAVGRGEDPFETLLDIIGLHASSVSFDSRKAVSDMVSWNALAYQGWTQEWRELLFGYFEDVRDAQLADLGLTENDSAIAELAFLRETDALSGPVIDGDPDYPLSETEPVRPFDSVRNYIDWLLEEDEATLRAQTFRDANGETTSRPAALLYQYLRHALLAELGRTASATALTLRPHELQTVAGQPTLIGFEATDQATLPDEAAISLDAARLGISEARISLGDYLLNAVRASTPLDQPGPAAAGLVDLTEALTRLKDLPTARLERLFAEHMDIVSHRLDAYHVGLFSTRLDALRRRDNTRRGLYLGAFGYLEDLRPRPAPTVVDPSELPTGLEGDRVVERADNGGHVHAPSLAHAMTAAVLRNGYLTHADPEQRESFSINLTSDRVRAALTIVEGLRAGQMLSALLGYQLERGLHENHPGLELDAYIWTLRAEFPATSRRLTDTTDGVAAERIEGRNVVDGYELVQRAREQDYPWSVEDLPADGSAEAGAIVDEVEALTNTLDAVSDLMMAESVHQVVEGNIERARGTMQAITEGDAPQIPEVALTPRSGRALTQRMIIHLPDAAAHWPTASPRGLANPRINAWLVSMLPDPAEIAVGFTLTGDSEQHLTLADSGLDATDAVLMAGERLGDGSSALERWLVDHWRATQAIAPDVATRFRDVSAPPPAGDALMLDPGSAPAGAISLEEIESPLVALRRLVTEGRPMTALDYRPPTEESAAQSGNPSGFVVDGSDEPTEARARVEAARASLDAARQALDAVVADPALITAHEALATDSTTYDPALWEPAIVALRDALRDVALHGAPEAEPASPNGADAGIARRLFDQGVEIARVVVARLERADALLAPILADPPPDDPDEAEAARAYLIERRATALRDAAKALLGQSFRLVFQIQLESDQAAEAASARAAPVETDPLRIEAWLQGLVRVRAPLDAFARILDWRSWTGGGEVEMLPIQLPRRAGDPWIGLEWSQPPAAGDLVSVMAVDPPVIFDQPMAGLRIDSFTETVPTEHETTGLAFHYDRPNASAPQALLLAVTPELNGAWSWDDLVDTILDNFDRARLRAVEPGALATTSFFQVAPATLVPFSTSWFASTLLVSNIASVAAELEQ